MNNSNIKILIIDDEIPILRILTSFLEDLEYVVSTATSGEMAIEKEKVLQNDIAIVDMRMDGMDGEETMIKLREINPNIRFIVHTGSSEFYINDELKKVGIKQEYFFKKPVLNMEIFVTTINKILKEENYDRI